MTTGAAEAAAPTRFAADVDWSRTASRELRLLARVAGTPDLKATEYAAIGDALRRGDGVADRLAAALSAGRVSMADVSAGVDAVGEALARGHRPDTATYDPDLAAFLAEVADTPDWLDPALADEGARACLRAGLTGMDVLGDLALLGGYRPSATTDLLVSTGRLTGNNVARRISETTVWWYQCVRPGGWHPGSAGWRMTVLVRLMHARVNRTYLEKGWDVEAKGLPINQADMAGTNLLFSAVFLAGTRVLGVPHTPGDSRAVMHLWRYLGWLMGVDDHWLADQEIDGIRHQARILLTSPPPTEKSMVLARALMATNDAGDRTDVTPFRRVVEQERHLSIASVFNGRRGMSEIGLPYRPPWYLAWIVPLNGLSHLAAAVVPGARFRKERRAERRIRAEIAGYSRGTVHPDDAM